jgi:hypothetical protein
LVEFSEDECWIVLLNYKCLVKLQMIKVFAEVGLLNKELLLKSATPPQPNQNSTVRFKKIMSILPKAALKLTICQ